MGIASPKGTVFIANIIVVLGAIIVAVSPATAQPPGVHGHTSTRSFTERTSQSAGRVTATSPFLKDDEAYRGLALRARTPLAPGPNMSPEERRAAQIWNDYGGILEVLSKRLGVQPEAMIAVIAVESGGKPFEDGRVVIRFEIHHFWRHWGEANRALFSDHFRYRSGDGAPQKDHRFRASASEPWTDIHDHGQTREWNAFRFARNLHPTAAIKSASWGMGQILGSNYDRLGYRTPEAMAEQFSDPAHGPRMQILGVLDFAGGGRENSPTLLALRSRDWEEFARRYNGADVTAYAARLRSYYSAAHRVLHP